MAGRSECISDDYQLKQIGPNIIPKSHQKEGYKAGCHGDDIFVRRGCKWDDEREQRKPKNLFTLRYPSRLGNMFLFTMVAHARKNQLITPGSPQGVVANEVHPYPPRFNQRTWRERCNAGMPFRTDREGLPSCCAKPSFLRDILMVGLRNLAKAAAAARDPWGKDNCNAFDERLLYMYNSPDIKSPKVIVSMRRL
jgi:hypothetical protein